MPRLMLGSVCGLVYGTLSAASMIPLEFQDKRAALFWRVHKSVFHRIRNWGGEVRLAELVGGFGLWCFAKSGWRDYYESLRSDHSLRCDRRNDYWFNRGQVGQL